jgi:Bacterial pre-peptidase C-terminal domain
VSQGGSATYSLNVSAGVPLRVSLAWTDYPASPISSRTLVNDLDLEVQPPSGPLLRGNTTADLVASCRDAASGADRCNNVESLEIAAPEAGVYTVSVRGAAVPQGPQPFALAARAYTIGDAALGAPTLQAIAGSPLVSLNWSAVASATFYQVEQSDSADFTELAHISTVAGTSLSSLADQGTHWFRVRACTPSACGAASDPQIADITSPPKRDYLQLVLN